MRYLTSPLVRHPRFLFRKIRDRMGWARPLRYPPCPLGDAKPLSVAPRLRAWAAACEVHQHPYLAHRVFHQDFNPALLERLCREGPTGASDLTGDLKLIWDYSRHHALFLNALRKCSSPEESAGEWNSWLDACSDRSSPLWSSPMDLAIGAVNALVADACMEGRLAVAVGSVLWRDILWEIAWRIEHDFQVRLLSTNNHYIAELMGLAWLGEYFSATPAGQKWSRFTRREMPRALRYLTYPDGGLHEASLPYHVFVTEMALVFELIQTAPLTDGWKSLVQQMVRVSVNMASERGDVFQVGDSDGGRVLPLEFVSDTVGHAQAVARLAKLLGYKIERESSLHCPESGWHVIRNAHAEAMLEFGGYGPFGQAGHGHNDALSLCVHWGNEALLIDPGTFLYTPDPVARNRFRSTAVHNTVQCDGLEQADLPVDSSEYVFYIRGPAQSCRAEVQSERAVSALYRHDSGYTHRRVVRLEEKTLYVEDEVRDGTPVWTFQFAPGARIEQEHDAAIISVGSHRVRMSWTGPFKSGVWDEGWVSPYYGSRVRAPRVRFSSDSDSTHSAHFIFEEDSCA